MIWVHSYRHACSYPQSFETDNYLSNVLLARLILVRSAGVLEVEDPVDDRPKLRCVEQPDHVLEPAR